MASTSDDEAARAECFKKGDEAGFGEFVCVLPDGRSNVVGAPESLKHILDRQKPGGKVTILPNQKEVPRTDVAVMRVIDGSRVVVVLTAAVGQKIGHEIYDDFLAAGWMQINAGTDPYLMLDKLCKTSLNETDSHVEIDCAFADPAISSNTKGYRISWADYSKRAVRKALLEAASKAARELKK